LHQKLTPFLSKKLARIKFNISHNVPQIAVVADLRREKLSADWEQRYENNIQYQEGAGNKGNLLLAIVPCCLPMKELSTEKLPVR